ncbi:MAG TPA: hypothetical protein VN802_19690 [Stellaceae bacterium]|nr:hypothetical protein [Stellaceae bacterium]
MASEAQIAANRANSSKSTGPKTAAGKAASSRNAFRHGLAAALVVSYDENPDEFERFFDEIRTAYAPADAVEDGLVERIVHGSWRLRRVWRAEVAALDAEAREIALHRARKRERAALKAEFKSNPPPELKDLDADAVERAVNRAVDDLSLDDLMDASGEFDDAALGVLKLDVAIWPEQIAVLSRYEAALERGVHRAAMLLERRQAQRRSAAPTENAPEQRDTEPSGDDPDDPANGQGERDTMKFAERSQFSTTAAPLVTPPPAHDPKPPP